MKKQGFPSLASSLLACPTVSARRAYSLPLFLPLFLILSSQVCLAALSDVYAYPVPWRPNATDSQRYGTATGGITFTNLPNPSEIRIFNLSGTLVKTISHTDSGITETWDGKYDSNADVKSGIYVYVIEYDSEKKSGKLMIIR